MPSHSIFLLHFFFFFEPPKGKPASMARLLRDTFLLTRPPFIPKGFKLGIIGTSQILSFSSKGRRRSKSDGSDSDEENMSKKELALQQALDQITSAFGNGSIMWLGRSVSPKSLPVVSTGSFALDVALGHVVEIYGPEASVKTILALHVIAEAQKQGGYCVFVDAEHALDKKLAESIGVNTTNLLLSQPDCGEQALSLVDTLIRSGSVDVIVVDSVAALVPKGELDGEMGHAHMAMQARLMSQALRKLSHCLVTFSMYINFYKPVRLNIKRIGFVKKGEEILGSQVLVKVVKNKLVPPFKIAEFELQFGKGISKETEIIDLSVKNKLISKAGAMFYYNEQSFRGKDALKNFLAENQSALEELEMKLREKLLNAETEKMWDVINGDVREAIATVDSTDEEAAAIVEA
ncbi:DNA repair protein recA 3, mitochondrial [Glycine max]|nr:DNA repair protein recA 3, mitochondrial [Glycine max]